MPPPLNGCDENIHSEVNEALFGLCQRGERFQKTLKFSVAPADPSRPRDVPRPEGRKDPVPADAMYLTLGGDALVDRVLSGRSLMACTYGECSCRRAVLKEVATQAAHQFVQRAQHMSQWRHFNMRAVFLECRLSETDIVYDRLGQQMYDAKGICKDTLDSISKQLTLQTSTEILARVGSCCDGPSQCQASSSGHFIFQLEAQHADEVGAITMVSVASLEQWCESASLPVSDQEAVVGYIGSVERLHSLLEAIQPASSGEDNGDRVLLYLGSSASIDKMYAESARRCDLAIDTCVSSCVDPGLPGCHGFTELMCVFPSPPESEKASWGAEDSSDMTPSTLGESENDLPLDESFTRVSTRQLRKELQRSELPHDEQMERLFEEIDRLNKSHYELHNKVLWYKDHHCCKCSGIKRPQAECVVDLTSTHERRLSQASAGSPLAADDSYRSFGVCEAKTQSAEVRTLQRGTALDIEIAKQPPGSIATRVGYDAGMVTLTDSAGTSVLSSRGGQTSLSITRTSEQCEPAQLLQRLSGSSKDFPPGPALIGLSQGRTVVRQNASTQRYAVSPQPPPRDMPPSRGCGTVQSGGQTAPSPARSILVPQVPGQGFSPTSVQGLSDLSSRVFVSSFEPSYMPDRAAIQSTPLRSISPPPQCRAQQALDLTPHSARPDVVRSVANADACRPMARSGVAVRVDQTSPCRVRIPPPCHAKNGAPPPGVNMANRSPLRTPPCGNSEPSPLPCSLSGVTSSKQGMTSFQPAAAKSPSRWQVRR